NHPGYGILCEQTVGGAPLSAEIDCPWDTTAYPDGTLSQNRTYVIRITATNAERSLFSPPSQPHTAERRAMVVNDVAAPTGVVLSSSEAGRQATVRWASNPEPDITSYVIQERFGSDGWRTVGEAGSQLRSFSRRLSAPGTYRYQVAARRSNGSGSESIQSAFSGPAAEPRQIVVEPPKPPPTTTTTSPAKGPDKPAPAPDPGGGGDAGPHPPAGDGPPVPVEAGGTAGENPAPAPPAESPPPGAPPGAPVLISPIAPGSPGSVGFGQTSAGNLVQKGGAAPSTPATAPEPDGPFSETLPYPKADPPPVDDDDEGIGKVLVGLPAVIASDNRRELIIPLAAGLLLFVVAMHAFYLSRRAGQTPLEPDF
ncbi:MAG TPA: fibronectin type III domain-containing protein, partial [Acidimicrobiia bacterium]